jgi:hypothetical protein
VVVVHEVLVVVVSVDAFCVDEVSTVLRVSTKVALDVVGVDRSLEAVVSRLGFVELDTDIPDQNVVVIVVTDVVAADDTVETVVVMVGPSGCLNRPIFPEAYIVNHTFSTPPALFNARPFGFEFPVGRLYSENLLMIGEYLPILLAVSENSANQTFPISSMVMSLSSELLVGML